MFLFSFLNYKVWVWGFSVGMYLLNWEAWSRDWKLSYVISSVGTLVFHSWLLYLHFWVGRPVCPFLSFVIEIGNWKLPFDILFVKVCACRARYLLFGLLDDRISSPDASGTKTEKFQQKISKVAVEDRRCCRLKDRRRSPLFQLLSDLISFRLLSFRFASEWFHMNSLCSFLSFLTFVEL